MKKYIQPTIEVKQLHVSQSVMLLNGSVTEGYGEGQLTSPVRSWSDAWDDENPFE